MMPVFAIYVEKKPEFAVEAAAALSEIESALKIDSISSFRIINRYFAENLSEKDFAAARQTVFSHPQTDIVSDELPEFGDAHVFAVEYLPGQFDQRADSAEQCVSLLLGCERPTIKSARVYAISGDIGESEISKIKAYLINPVESRETGLTLPESLAARFATPPDVAVLNGFTGLDSAGVADFIKEYSLAMDFDDLCFCRDYFAREGRDPTITEIRMIDTYWSDHCRHTTFLTNIDSAEISDPDAEKTWKKYLDLREKLYAGKDKPITLMDLATIGAKTLKSQGLLKELDESGEINACSVKIKVDVDGRDEDWLLMFKNETHNHPTEIEPFGGAATCLGGGIRDPLSGRSYVYQAMRITGAGDPTNPDTLAGKLPQRKLCQTAAAGYSSYGNQIGLASGHLHEIYHPGYVAKRMELGALVGAVPTSDLIREVPAPGDVVILLGGRTGRDGCGGATGSSKSHTISSLETCGAEVQKGNPPEERKIVRLFRNPEATRLIKRCNDFGAGGVSVAIGELADGLDINLDAVPVKYDGLDGTELAISESQERMAVVIAKSSVDAFIRLAAEENLEATIVAEVASEPRLKMCWRGNTIVDLSREFLNSNGAVKHTDINIPNAGNGFASVDCEIDSVEKLVKIMSDVRFCSQKGLAERFDATASTGTVLMPYGGLYQLTPAQVMAAKIPALNGEAKTCSIMAWGYSPEIMCASTYYGGIAAVVESVAKAIAAGGSRKNCWLSFQEYFEGTNGDPKRWGKPASALLGALEAQLNLKLGAIGGKDSMSGSFEDLDVPPTLVSFAVSVANADSIISPEFKAPGGYVYEITPCTKSPEKYFEDISNIFDKIEELVAAKKIRSAWAIGEGGSAVAVTKMCYGNRVGFKAVKPLNLLASIGGFIFECGEPLDGYGDYLIGETTAEYTMEFCGGNRVSLDEVQLAWENTLESVYPCNAQPKGPVNPEAIAQEHAISSPMVAKNKVAKPRVLIPVFPGTNCEYDTARAFEKAGAETEFFIIKNLTPAQIKQSAEDLAKRIAAAQIIALPGGSSGGDEPDGSAKFTAAFLRGAKISDEIMKLLTNRDGLMLGICNGFQALIKLGLVPYGEIRKPDENAPTLATNTIGRTQCKFVRTKIVSNKSPWLQDLKPGSIFTMPVASGEGRFVVSPKQFEELSQNGQIAAVYVDLDGNPTRDVRYNPSNSYAAVEALLSPDGRILGKMAHCERCGDNLYKNIPVSAEECFMDIFSGAVKYYG